MVGLYVGIQFSKKIYVHVLIFNLRLNSIIAPSNKVFNKDFILSFFRFNVRYKTFEKHYKYLLKLK